MITPEEFSRGLIVDSARMYLASRYLHNLPSFAGNPDRFVKEVRTYLEAAARGRQPARSPLWQRDLTSQFPELIELRACRRSLFNEMEAWADSERERIASEPAPSLSAAGSSAPLDPPASIRRGKDATPHFSLEDEAQAEPLDDPLMDAIVATAGTSASESQIAAYRRIP